MRGFLGEEIREGAFSDVHAWAPGQVVKLFKASVRPRNTPGKPAAHSDDCMRSQPN